MSTLAQSIERLCADENIGNPFYGIRDHVSSLRVEEASGKLWVLPWSHFTSGRHERIGSSDHLVLTFVACEVGVHGMRLSGLVADVANQRLEWLRAAPGKYLKSTSDGPAIERIAIRSLAEPVMTP